MGCGSAPVTGALRCRKWEEELGVGWARQKDEAGARSKVCCCVLFKSANPRNKIKTKIDSNLKKKKFEKVQTKKKEITKNIPNK